MTRKGDHKFAQCAGSWIFTSYEEEWPYLYKALKSRDDVLEGTSMITPLPTGLISLRIARKQRYWKNLEVDCFTGTFEFKIRSKQNIPAGGLPQIESKT